MNRLLREKLLKPKIALFGTILIFLFLFITNGVPFIYSDGYCYYHISKSIIDHGSYVSPVEPEYYDYKGHVITKYRDNYATVCAPGSAFLNLPGLAIASAMKTDQTIYNDYFMAFNGHTIYEGLSVLITASTFALLSIFLMYKIVLELGYNYKVAILSTFAVYTSSYAVWYVFLSPFFTHTYEVFSASLLVWSYIRYRKTGELKYILISGIASGLGVIIRPTFAFVVILIGLALLLLRKIKPILIFALGGVPFLLLWMSYNFVSYGKLISSGYGEIRGENFTFSAFNGHNVLFSFYRGWYIYSPIFLLATIGLVIFTVYYLRRRKTQSIYSAQNELSVIALIFIIVNAITYGFWPAWWAGGSYGHRFMLVLVPFGLVGLLNLFSYIKEVAKQDKYKLTLRIFNILVAITVLWSITLTLLYRFTPVAELRPRDDQDGIMMSGDRYTPFDMFNYHINLISNSESLTGYLSSLVSSIRGGASLIALPIGISDSVLRIDDRPDSKIEFLLIEPGTRKQELPSEINFYLKNANNDVVYKVKIGAFGIVDKYWVYCDLLCKTNHDDISMQLLTENDFSLSRQEYDGFKTSEGDYEMYFQKSRNLFVKGHPIYVPNDAIEYKL